MKTDKSTTVFLTIMAVVILFYTQNSLSNTNIRMGESLHGFVTNEQGLPIIGADVTITIKGSATAIAEVYTNENGMFDAMFDINQGESLHVYVNPNNGLTGQYWSQEGTTTSPPKMGIVLNNDYSELFIHIKVRKAPEQTDKLPQTINGSIRGRITNEMGSNTTIDMENIDIELVDANGAIIDAAMMTKDGEYVLFNVPSDKSLFIKITPPSTSEYPIQYWSGFGPTATMSESITVAPFQGLFLNEMILSKTPVDTYQNNAILKINLLNPDKSLNTGQVNLELIRKDGFRINHHRMDLIANPDADTIIEFFIPADEYGLKIMPINFPEQYYNPLGNTANHDMFYYMTLLENDTTELIITLTNDPQIQASINGIVRDIYNQPLANISIVAMSKESIWNNSIMLPDPHHDYIAKSNDRGEYQLTDMRSGEYIILAFSQDDNYLAQFHPETQSMHNAQPVQINIAAQPLTINFDMKKGATIEGYVKDPDSLGIKDIRIEIWDQKLNMDSAVHSFSYQTNTAENGHFIFRGIPQGKWYATVHDEKGPYFVVNHNFDEVVISGTKTFYFDKTIILEAGGYLTGTFSLTDTSFNNYHHFGRFFFYDNNYLTSDIDPYLFNHYWIGVRYDADDRTRYVSDAIPNGTWKIVFSPEVPEKAWDPSYYEEKPFFNSLNWMYIDNAISFSTSKSIVIEKKIESSQNIELQSKGFCVYGSIKSADDPAEIFGGQSSTNDIHGKWFQIRVFIKEDGKMIQIAESRDVHQNQFVIPGLKNGDTYYLNAVSENYPDQWWTGIDSLISSCDPEDAMGWMFSITDFAQPKITMLHQPKGYDDWKNEDHFEGPEEITDITFKSLGFSAISLSWSEPISQNGVSSYVIYRINNVDDPYHLFEKNNYGWEPINEDSLFSILDSTTVYKTSFIDTNVIADVNYMYVVIGIDQDGYGGKALSKDVPLEKYITSVSYNDFTLSTIVQKDSWQMVGICGLDTIETTNSNTTKIFYWDAANDSSKLYSHYANQNIIAPNQGVWVFSDVQLTHKITTMQIDNIRKNMNNITIHLDSGWNQISSPFPYSIAPFETNKEIDFHSWDSKTNGYLTNSYMEPWVGYWIHSEISQTLKIQPTPKEIRSLSRTRSSLLWNIQVSLIGSNFSDPDNFAGIISHDENQQNRRISFEPPQAFDYPNLYFIENNHKFAKLYYKESMKSEKKFTWKIGIAPSKDSCQIKFKNFINIPENIHLFWISPSGAVNLRKNSLVDIAPHNETEYGFLIASTNTMDISMYTGHYQFMQNYPNPFRHSTNFSFTVPYLFDGQNSDGTKLNIDIYNLLGKKIITVYSQKVIPGNYTIRWNGNTINGKSLPSGVYIARLTASNFVKSIQMFKMR